MDREQGTEPFAVPVFYADSEVRDADGFVVGYRVTVWPAPALFIGELVWPATRAGSDVGHRFTEPSEER